MTPSEQSVSERGSSPDRARSTQNATGESFGRQQDDSDNGAGADATVAGASSKPGKAKARRSQGPTGGANAQSGTTSKVRHLKKEDGEPLFRRDIQYDFLRAVFDNEQKVFTNSYDVPAAKQTFADLYIDTMARSSKTSKVLRDKLLSDREAAKSMAMVCLLVNVGRMNTTLNCMDAQLLSA
jgi:Ino eighty subunit 1